MKNDELCDVAVVILNYNTPSLTISTASHLLDQKIGVRVVIVDNASTDDSLQRIKRHFSCCSEVFVVETGLNGGYAKGNNVGIAYAERLEGIHFVGVMNPDVELDAEDLLLLVNALKGDSSIGLVTGRTIYNGKKFEPCPCAFKRASLFRWIIGVTLIGSVLRHIILWWSRGNKELNWQGYYSKETYEKDIVVVHAVQGCLFFARLENWKKIGGFDESTFLYFEEDILAEKVRNVGLHNAVVRDAWIRHNHQEKERAMQRRSERLFNLQCDYESRKYILQKYSGYGFFMEAVLSIFWNIDFRLRSLFVSFLFRN